MVKIFVFIFSLIIGIFLGNVVEMDLIKGMGLLLFGIILTFYIFYMYKKMGLFVPSNKQIELILMICLEVIGFVIGFTGLIYLDEFKINLGIIIFLVLFVFWVFIIEIIKLFKHSKS